MSTAVQKQDVQDVNNQQEKKLHHNENWSQDFWAFSPEYKLKSTANRGTTLIRIILPFSNI